MMTTTQKPDQGELRNEFAWSWSRHEMFYACARKIYWQYYGSWGGWEPDASADAKLAYRLKRMTTVSMLVGNALHEVVSERLRERPDVPGRVPAQQIRDEVERRVLNGMRESRNRYWEKFEHPKFYTLLFEDYYGSGIDDEARTKALELVRDATEGFAKSVYARRAFWIDKSRLRIIDPRDFDAMKFTIDGVVVYAVPDLVVQDDDGVLHIVDWKTGRSIKANHAQLAMYGLYVAEKLGVPLERVHAHLVYVRTGERQEYTNLTESVDEALRRLATYTADVRSRLTDVENNVAGDVKLFPMTENRRLCRQCKFQELCGRRDPSPELPDDDESNAL